MLAKCALTILEFKDVQTSNVDAATRIFMEIFESDFTLQNSFGDCMNERLDWLCIVFYGISKTHVSCPISVVLLSDVIDVNIGIDLYDI